jgi:N-acyl-D-amino-acid deacylase
MGQPIAGSNPALSAISFRPCGAGPPVPHRARSAGGPRPAHRAAAAGLAFAGAPESRIIGSMFDVIIQGGDLIDGTGAPPRRADVGIARGDIAAVDDLSAAQAERRIDATGLAVAPGFIDTHTHTEGVLLGDPQHAMGLRQGITTEIFGLDGLSYAPASRDNYLLNRRYLAGLLGWPPEDLDTSTVAAFRQAYHRTVAINTAYLAAHGVIRLEALGFHDAPLVGEPLDHARRLVTESIEGGAVGISSGLNYYPNAWADTAELIALADAVHAAGSIHVIELRTSNPERAFKGGGLAEAMEVGRRSGSRIHVAHHRTQPWTAGQTDALLAEAEAAAADGVDVSFDIYPYPSGSSYPISYLPPWVHEGGPDAILERLADATTRARIAEQMDRDYDQRVRNALTAIVLSHVPSRPELDGARLADVAAERGVTEGTVLAELLLENELDVSYVTNAPQSTGRWRQTGRDAMRLLARDDYMVCSDITPIGSVCHPRSFGAYPRFLGRLRRAFGGLTLEGMVARMTDVPARRFGLPNRGRIQPGYRADITVFDADRVIDTATYDDPRQYPVGIPYVLVNGAIAVDGGVPTGALAGEAVP